MYHWLFIAMIFSTLVIGQETEIFHFSKDVTELSKCIENQKIDAAIANPAAGIFSGSFNKTREHISNEVTKMMIMKLLSKELEWLSKNPESWKEKHDQIEQAIVNCADSRENSDASGNVIHFDKLNRVQLPRFTGEADIFGAVLNYVLVDWLDPLENMIRTRNGRALLRRFANGALFMLGCTLDHNTPILIDHFRVVLRVIWMRRAQIYFDGRNLVSYIPHRFTADYITPYTYGEVMSMISNRRDQNFALRNPRVEKIFSDRILNIHASDRPGNGENDIFAEYEKCGMTSAEYYLECHVIQFYRVLFFVQELELRGIWFDEDDKYEGPLPYDFMPKEIQEIIYNDDGYRDFLLKRRRLETYLGNINNKLIQNLGKTARVREEDMIELFNSHLINNMVSSNTTTSTTTVPTTLLPQVKRTKKGSVCFNDKGKHFTKRRKTFPNSCCNSDGENSKTAVELTKSCLKKQFNYNVSDTKDSVFSACSLIHETQELLEPNTSDEYFGYILEHEDSNHKLLSEEELSTYTEILSDIGSAFNESAVDDELRRRRRHIFN